MMAKSIKSSANGNPSVNWLTKNVWPIQIVALAIIAVDYVLPTGPVGHVITHACVAAGAVCAVPGMWRLHMNNVPPFQPMYVGPHSSFGYVAVAWAGVAIGYAGHIPIILGYVS